MIRVRMVVSRLPGRALRMQVRGTDPDALQAVLAFAREHSTPYEVDVGASEWYVQAFFLPADFGEPPLATVREAPRFRTPRGARQRVRRPVAPSATA